MSGKTTCSLVWYLSELKIETVYHWCVSLLMLHALSSAKGILVLYQGETKVILTHIYIYIKSDSKFKTHPTVFKEYLESMKLNQIMLSILKNVYSVCNIF